MSKSREQVNKWLSKINLDGKTCLEFGAGKPEQWALHNCMGEPKEYATSDIDPKFKCDEIIDLNKPLDYEPKPYDITLAIEVLEHVWNPIEAIKTISKFTKDTVYITTPFINPLHDHVDYLRYTFQWYEKVMMLHGFKDIKVCVREATYKKELQEFYSKEGMRVSKVTVKKYGNGLENHVGYMVAGRK